MILACWHWRCYDYESFGVLCHIQYSSKQPVTRGGFKPSLDPGKQLDPLQGHCRAYDYRVIPPESPYVSGSL